MKIYTRTGDAGTTSIVGGTRLPKDAKRIEAYGTVDELNSFLGLIMADASTPEPQRALLRGVQNTLLNIGGYLAGTPSPDIPDGQTAQLEDSIDSMERELPPLRNFILPGGCTLAARAHVARTVCRRAERRIISLAPDMTLPADLLGFVNRLSDWLYTFARYANFLAQVDETTWQKS